MFEMRAGVQELNNTPAGAGDNRGCSSSGHASLADLKFFSFASVVADSNADDILRFARLEANDTDELQV